ncbi:class I SAM-dependent methyltransferase [Leptospira inadai]|nr:class I SAM-dependent methyltransferase [Leptospira inadai]
MRKHLVSYFLCPDCGALQTEAPYWLDEAYNSAIIDADTGLVARNIFFSEMLSCVLFHIFGAKGKFLDLAGGYGMMTRLMRDRGFDYYWSDPYCENILAKGFGIEDSGCEKFDAVSAFEVLEHTVHPKDFVRESLSRADTFVFTTEIFREPVPDPRDWFYYAFEGGQHIIFFQNRTLSKIADDLSLHYFSNGVLHIFSKKSIAKSVVLLSRTRLRGLYLFWISKRMRSRIMKDHHDLVSRVSC